MPYIPIVILALACLVIRASLGLPAAVGVVYIVMSVICFSVYAVDKAAARAGKRRTKESTLLLIGLGCGWPGAILAQQWLRHKSSKASFRLKFFVTIGVNIAVFILLAMLPAVRHLS